MPLCDNIYFSYMIISILLYGILYSSYVILYMLRPIRHPSLSASREFCMNMRDASLVLHNYSSSTPRECPCGAQKIFQRRIRGLWAFCGTRCQSADYAFLRLRMHFSYLRKSLSCMPEEPLRRHGLGFPVLWKRLSGEPAERFCAAHSGCMEGRKGGRPAPVCAGRVCGRRVTGFPAFCFANPECKDFLLP